MADFTYVEDQLDERVDFNVDKIQFGDGYSQRVPNGINNALRIWDVAFTDRSKTDADAIVSFFRTRQGATSFTWRPTGYSADVKVVCPSYSKPVANRYFNGALVYSVKARFEEVPL